MHKDWTLRALQAGKHVLCEKPMAMNERDAAEMFDAAEQAGRVLVEAIHVSRPPADRRGWCERCTAARSASCV